MDNAGQGGVLGDLTNPLRASRPTRAACTQGRLKGRCVCPRWRRRSSRPRVRERVAAGRAVGRQLIAAALGDDVIQHDDGAAGMHHVYIQFRRRAPGTVELTTAADGVKSEYGTPCVVTTSVSSGVEAREWGKGSRLVARMKRKRSDNPSSTLAYGSSYKIVDAKAAKAAAYQFEEAASLIMTRDYERAQRSFAGAVALMERAFDSMPFPVEVAREFEDREEEPPVWVLTSAKYFLRNTARRLREGRALHAVEELGNADCALSEIYRNPENYA